MAARPALHRDAPGIAELVNHYALEGLILPRAEQAIWEAIDDWRVISADRSVLACGSLVRYTPMLAELRSLAVVESSAGQGMGTAIVRALVQLAQERGYRKLFALTRIAPFFQRMGFAPSSVEAFPQKVWRDCVVCPLIHRCDEQAVVLQLDGGAISPFAP